MRIILIIALFTCFNQYVFTQNNNEVLAKFGDREITVEEFRYRYEFTPQINRKHRDSGKAKEELLFTLIAENLFALEAEKLRFDTLNIIKIVFRYLTLFA